MNDDKGYVLFRCGCLLLVLAFNLFIGNWSVVYILNYFDKTIPLIGSVLIGLVAGEVTIPVAIVMWILKFFGAI